MSFYYGKHEPCDKFDDCGKCGHGHKKDCCLLDCLCGILRSCLCHRPRPKPIVCDTVCRCKTVCRQGGSHCRGFDGRDKCIY